MSGGSGQTAASAGQQSLNARGRVGLGAAAGGFDADLYTSGSALEEEKARFATEIAAEDDDADMTGNVREKSGYQRAQEELERTAGGADYNPFDAYRTESRVSDRDNEYTKRRHDRTVTLSPTRHDPFAEELAQANKKPQQQQANKRKNAAEETASTDAAAETSAGDGASTTSYRDIMQKHLFERDNAEVMRNLKKKAQQEADLQAAATDAAAAAAADTADIARKRRRFEDAPSDATDKTAAEMPSSTGILLDDSENWAAMPVRRDDDDEEEDEEDAFASNGAPALTSWDATPQVLPQASARKSRSRWDQSDATPMSSTLSTSDATPLHPGGAGDATPMYTGNETPSATTTKKRSRWGETPLAASLRTGADVPMAPGANATSAASLMATPMHMTSEEWQRRLAAMTPEQLQALRAEQDIAQRNRPLSDEDLDALLPGEKDGYKIVRPPDGYQPIRRASERQMLMTPTPLGQEGFFIPADTPGIKFDVPPAPADSGLPAFQKEDDTKYFGALLEEVDEAQLTKAQLTERRIMKLLLKIKNGSPPQRKTALRTITEKAREFGAAPLFDQILPLLMSPTLEDSERHVLVKVIDRVLYKLDDLVRPYVHKILIVIEPMLIEGDYFARVEGREIISNLAKAAGLATMIATMRPDLDNVDEFVRNCVIAGTRVTLGDGTSRPIEEIDTDDFVLAVAMTPRATSPSTVAAIPSDAASCNTPVLVSRRVTEVLRQGPKACIELTFADGRSLVCTPDHRILTAQGVWTQASSLIAGESKVVAGFDPPVYSLDEDATRCATWSLDLRDSLGVVLDMVGHRDRTLAFFRLLGYTLADRTIATRVGRNASAELCLAHEFDVASARRDIELVCGSEAAQGVFYRNEMQSGFRLALPSKLAEAFFRIGVSPNRRGQAVTRLPAILTSIGTMLGEAGSPTCPQPIVRAFLAGLFGGDGHTLVLGNKKASGHLHGLGFSTSYRADVAGAQMAVLKAELGGLLVRCGIPAESLRWDTVDMGPSSITAAGRNALQLSRRLSAAELQQVADRDPTKSLSLLLTIHAAGVIPFGQHVGFAHCCVKQHRLDVGMVVFRTHAFVLRQRKAIVAEYEQLPKTRRWYDHFTAARDAVAAREPLHPAVASWRPSQESQIATGVGRFWLRYDSAARTLTPIRLLSDILDDHAAVFGSPHKMPYYNAVARQAEIDERADELECVVRHYDDDEAQLMHDVGHDSQEIADAVGTSVAAYEEEVEEFDDLDVILAQKHTYSIQRGAAGLPTWSSRLLAVRPAGVREVFDLVVPTGRGHAADESEASFVANGVVAHNCTARAFAVVASALGVHSLLPFLKAVCQSKKSWEARHTGMKIVQQIAILTGSAVLAHLTSLVEIVEHGLTDDQSKVRCIAALAIAALAEAAHPYGIESFGNVLRPLWLGIRQHRSKTLAAFLKAIGFIIPLMEETYALYYTKEVMVILIREFATPDEEMKKIVLKVIKQCVQTNGVEPAYIRTEILPPFFQHFWVRRMALDKRNYAELVSTTEALAQKVGGGEIIARIVDDLKDESEPYRKMVMETIDAILSSLGAADIDSRLEPQLIDGALYAFQEQTSEDTRTMLNGFGVIITSLGARARAYLPQVAGIIKWRLNNKLARVRQQAADLIARIAIVLRTCQEEALMQHLGVVLYEMLGEEYPDVLASILGALKAIVNVIGMQNMTPPIKDLLPRLTPILRNRHERVQETTIDLVGRIADRGAEFVSAKEWMRICFELLDMLKAQKKGIRRACVSTFGFIAKAIGPHDVLATLLNNLKVQERQNRVCTTVAIAIVAETCAPFTVLPALMNEYRVPELNVQNGVLKALSFLFEYIGETGKDYVYVLLPLLEDALMERDAVHRQTAASVVKHLSLGVHGLSREDAMAHLLNFIWPNIFETSPHLINAVMDAIEGLRAALGPTKILQYLVQGLFHPARKVRTIYWKLYNTMYIASQDALVPSYPRLTDEKDRKFRRWELEQFL